MTDKTTEVLTTLIALERDRELGYAPDQLAADPRSVIEQGLEVLAEEGYDPEEVVFPEDQESLGINVTDD